MMKKKISKNAAMILVHAKKIYNKSLQIKAVQPVQLEKLANKYNKIFEHEKRKQQEHQENVRKRREECEEKYKKCEGIKQTIQQNEKERMQKVLDRIEQRSKQAEDYRQRKNLKKVNNYNKVKACISTITYEDDIKQVLRTLKADKVKLYSEYIKAIRNQTALQTKIKITKDLTNPYIVAELRANKELENKMNNKSIN